MSTIIDATLETDGSVRVWCPVGVTFPGGTQEFDEQGIPTGYALFWPKTISEAELGKLAQKVYENIQKSPHLSLVMNMTSKPELVLALRLSLASLSIGVVA